MGEIEPGVIVLVGGGPTASSLLERLAANVPELLGPERRLRVHLVDPFRAGTGRVWREDLSPLLWMNSMAEDVTLFVDESVRCEGPHRPGPSLHEWARTVDDVALAELAGPELAVEIRSLGPMTFPTRRVQSVYLDWFHRQVLASLPAEVDVVVHGRPAIDVTDVTDVGDDGGGGRQLVHLDGGGDPIEADAVVLALGHLDAAPDATSAAHTSFAHRHGLVHLPPSHTAEVDLAVLEPGADVLVAGFGQAFTDLVVLVTEGRGGRFAELTDGRLRYEPSGDEPVLHVGSRRGVPYRAKLDYRLRAHPAPLPRVLDDAAIERLLDAGPLEFRRDVLPLVLREVSWAAYHELFHAHPDRVTARWDDIAQLLLDAPPAELGAALEAAIPDPADRVDLLALDRPLAGVVAPTAAALHDHVVGHITADLARRTDPRHSADLGAFNALLTSFGALGRLAPALTARSRVEDLGGWWFSFFMYYASGPPPARLRQLLALADVGLVRFVGGGMRVGHDDALGAFVATSAHHPEAIVARALVDARIAAPSVARTTDALLASLRDRGDVVEEVVLDHGWQRTTGKVVVAGPDLRVVGDDGGAHPARHAVGTFTSRPAAGAFARPRTNAPAFRQHDAVARSLLAGLASRRTGERIAGLART